MSEKTRAGKGEVINFLMDKGYGFIKTEVDDSKGNVFFHISSFVAVPGYDKVDIAELLKSRGTKVEYEAELSDRGWRATSAKLALCELGRLDLDIKKREKDRVVYNLEIKNKETEEFKDESKA